MDNSISANHNAEARLYTIDKLCLHKRSFRNEPTHAICVFWCARLSLICHFSAQEIRRQCNTNYLDELGHFAALRAWRYGPQDQSVAELTIMAPSRVLRLQRLHPLRPASSEHSRISWKTNSYDSKLWLNQIADLSRYRDLNFEL